MTAYASSGHLRVGSKTDGVDLYRVTTAPNTGGGRAADLGSLAMDNVTGQIWRKFDIADTDWAPIGPPTYVPNEMWAQNDVTASQSDVGLETNVSQLFSTWRAPRAGSIVGLVTRFSEAITAGSVTLKVRVNGTPGTLVATSVAGTGTQVVQAPGIDTYAAGDLLDIAITTDGGFLPITTDVEAYLQVQDATA